LLLPGPKSPIKILVLDTENPAGTPKTKLHKYAVLSPLFLIVMLIEKEFPYATFLGPDIYPLT
jgi:hypothetical protein